MKSLVNIMATCVIIAVGLAIIYPQTITIVAICVASYVIALAVYCSKLEGKQKNRKIIEKEKSSFIAGLSDIKNIKDIKTLLLAGTISSQKFSDEVWRDYFLGIVIEDRASFIYTLTISKMIIRGEDVLEYCKGEMDNIKTGAFDEKGYAIMASALFTAVHSLEGLINKEQYSGCIIAISLYKK